VLCCQFSGGFLFGFLVDISSMSSSLSIPASASNDEAIADKRKHCANYNEKHQLYDSESIFVFLAVETTSVSIDRSAAFSGMEEIAVVSQVLVSVEDGQREVDIASAIDSCCLSRFRYIVGKVGRLHLDTTVA